MSIDSINSTKQVINIPKEELQKQDEAKTKQQTNGSTRDIIATLGVLASIGIAAVAIIKSKNAQKELQEALKKAELEKNKLAEEAKKAAEDAKKAAEEAKKKAEEAVEKAKEDLQNNKPKSGNKKTSGGGSPKPSKGSSRGSVPTSTERRAITPHAEPRIEPKPIVEPRPTEVHAEPTTVVEPKPVVEPRPTEVHAEPTTVVEPKPVETVAEPVSVTEPEVPATPKKPYTKPESSVIEIKPEQSAEAIAREEQIAKAEADYKEIDMKNVARNCLDEKPTPQPIDVLGNINLSKPLYKMTDKELLFEYNALKDAVQKLSVEDPAAKRFLEIKSELENKRAYRITKEGIMKREGVLDEYTKEGLEYLENQEAAAKKVLEESNTRNAKWFEEQQARREAEYEQRYLNAEKEKIEDIAKQLDEEEAVARRAIEESDARNAKWLEEQQAIKQDEYEAMFLNAEREKKIADGARVLERGNLDVDLNEVADFYKKAIEEGKNGIIFVPRETKLSNAVQRATDYVSEQWGKFRGLFGKKKPAEIQPEPKPFKPDAEKFAAWAEQMKNKRIEEGKQVKEQVEKQLKDNSEVTPIQEFIDSQIPRKHNKHYHDKLQRQYDKLAKEESKKINLAENSRNILNEKPTPQPIDVLGNINLSKPLYKMTDKELLFEYNALKDAVQKLSVEDPAAKRFLEIKSELENKRAYRITKEGIMKREGVLDEYTKEGLEYLENQEAAAKKVLEESNTRNAKWFEEQHAKREAEYEKMYLNAEKQKINAEKEKIENITKQLDEQEAEAKKAIEESDTRNAQWLEEQQAKREAEYEKMYLDAEKQKIDAEKEKIEDATKKAEETAKIITDDTPKIVQESTGGVNQLPESFNQEQRNWLKSHGFIKEDNVTKYPKLYSSTHGKIEIPMNILNKNQIEYLTSNGFVIKGDMLVSDVSKSLPKDKKALKKLMKKLDEEHKMRRINDASKRVGIGNESSLYNPIDVPQNTRYNYKKYKSMEKERPTDADWQPEMTRDELMQNIEKYMNEEIARTKINHKTQQKQSFWKKLKNKFGL